MGKQNKNNYDAFLSYSSKDEKYVRIIQKAIENYTPPKAVLEEKTRLKLFRDKDDQGVSESHEAVFNKWIDKIPGFLLIGSKNSLDSEPVGREVTQFISKDTHHICLSWLDDKVKPTFHDAIAQKYPKAIFADFRMLKTTNIIRWLLKDRKLFKIEILRIVATLLAQKVDQEITLDQLIRREKQRTIKRRLITLSAIMLFASVLSIYLFSTPKFGWQHTALFDKDISNCQLKIINGKPKLWVTCEIEKRWEDDSTAESGYDNDVNFYQLNEDGEIEGELVYSTCGIDKDLCGNPKSMGMFARLNEKEILKIINNAQVNTDNSLTYDTNYDQFSNVSSTTSPDKAGVIFMCAVEDKYPYAPKMGGAYRSLDSGKNWEPLRIDFWNSFSDIVFDIRSINSFSVILTKRIGTNLNFPLDNPALLPSIWSTHDDGITWKQIKSKRQNINIGKLDLIWMTGKGNLIGTIPRNDNSNQLIIYKKRSIIDRLLQKFDDF